MIAAGLVPATLEMMDQKVMRIIEAYVQVGLPVTAQAALIVEVDGYPASLDGQIEEIAAILQAHGGYDLRIAHSEEERQQIWYGRKSAAGAFARLAPGLLSGGCHRAAQQAGRRRCGPSTAICERHELTVGHVFHAGDGNLHPAIVFDPKEDGIFERILAAVSARSWRSAWRTMGASPANTAWASRSAPYMALMYRRGRTERPARR